MNIIQANIDHENALKRISDFYISTFDKRARIEVIDSGLNLFNDLIDCKNVSLFFLNKETFDFNYMASLGHNEQTAVILFEQLTERGGITKCLEAEKAVLYQYEDYLLNNRHFFMIPLIGTFGLVGIIVAEINDDHLTDQRQTQQLDHFAIIFALIIENHNLIQELQDEKASNEERDTIRQTVIVQSTIDLKKILDSVHIGIMLVNVSDQKIVDVNAMAAIMIGTNKERLLDQKINKYLYSLNPITAANKHVDNHEGLLKKENGNLISILRRSARVDINNEKFYLESFIDISERKLMEDELQKSHFKLEQRVEERTIELRKANLELSAEIHKRIKAESDLVIARDKAEESNRLKSALLANMSHEFRTPLVSILGFSEMLEQDLEDDEQKLMMKNVYSSGHRLLKTLDGVLNLSQLQTNTYPVAIEKTEIIGLLEKQFIKFSPLFEEKKLSLKNNIEPGPININLDPGLFSTAVGNILDNALKYTESGGAALNIFITPKNEKTLVTISISDTGIGIDPKDQEMIFEEFRQTSEGFTRNYEGCGLGLTIAKRMIELNNGSIFLESTPGKGSNFTIQFSV
ncbi:MAG: hypothetical protein CVV24_10735 [Ignavibacteriae bacterium HGW-Ignavibacteriae-3]|nr:MAG: hypothetical protein CVV24_10735 [Ignavibacteriae bacterium HGW-Ignavibacteriae-3]